MPNTKNDPFELYGDDTAEYVAQVTEARRRRRAEKRSILAMHKTSSMSGSHPPENTMTEYQNRIDLETSQTRQRISAIQASSYSKSNSIINSGTTADASLHQGRTSKLAIPTLLPSDIEEVKVNTPTSDTTESAKIMSSSDEEPWPNLVLEEQKTNVQNTEQEANTENSSEQSREITPTNTDVIPILTDQPAGHLKKLNITESPVTPPTEDMFPSSPKRKFISQNADQSKSFNSPPLLEDAPLVSIKRKKKNMRHQKTTATTVLRKNEKNDSSLNELKPKVAQSSTSSAPLLENAPIISLGKKTKTSGEVKEMKNGKALRESFPDVKLTSTSKNLSERSSVLDSNKERKNDIERESKRNDIEPNVFEKETKCNAKRNVSHTTDQSIPRSSSHVPNRKPFSIKSPAENQLTSIPSSNSNVVVSARKPPVKAPQKKTTERMDIIDDEVICLGAIKSTSRKRTQPSFTTPLKRARVSQLQNTNNIVTIFDDDCKDIVLEWSPPTEGPKKNWQKHVDEIQYLFDGIFLQGHNKNLRTQTRGNLIITSSLKTFIEHTLKKPPQNSLLIDTDSLDNFSPILQILHESPKLFQTVIRRLCRLFGNSRGMDALLALLMFILYDSSLKRPEMIKILGKAELDLLLAGFFRNCATSVQEGKNKSSNRSLQLSSQDRASSRKLTGVNSKDVVNKLIAKLGIVQDRFGVFYSETDASSFLLGKVISKILERVDDSRMWMRENRRLDKVVALMYTCDGNFVESWKPMHYVASVVEEFDEDPQPYSDWVVLGSCVKILDSAAVDSICQDRLVEETRVFSMNLKIIKAVLKLGFVEYANEWLLLNSLKLCINLLRLSRRAIYEFIQANGLQMIIDCLTIECRMSGILTEKNKKVEKKGFNFEEDSYDTRVLCIALLAIVVYQDVQAREEISTVASHVDGGDNIGALSVIQSIMFGVTATEKCEYDSKGGMSMFQQVGHELSGSSQPWKNKEREDSRPKRQTLLEGRITMGYVSLLIGCLVRRSPKNRKLFEELLPKNSLQGMAVILDEFLAFHHDVGVDIRTMDKMFEDATMALVGSELPTGTDIRSTVLAGVNQNDFTMDLLRAGGVKTKKGGYVPEKVDLEGLEFVEVNGDGDLVDMLYPDFRKQED